MSKKQKPLVDYAISAISQDDFAELLDGSLRKGTSFTVGDLDALCMTITDDDKKLDTYKHFQHGDDDRHDDDNQTAEIEGVGGVGEIEAGALIRLKSDTGEKYEMVQLVTETGGKFWTFVGDIPDADETLTISKVYDHKKVKYKDGMGVKYVVAGDDTLETDEDTATSGNLLTNDCIGFSASHHDDDDDDDDGDGGIVKDDFRVVAVEDGEVGTTFTVLSARGNEALVTVAADGTVTVDPTGRFDSLAQGETDTITLEYTVGATRTEGKGKKATEILETDKGELTIVVNGVNDGPQAVDDSYVGSGTIEVDVAAGVLANDVDIDGDILTASVVTGPVNGTLSLQADGSFTYTPTSLFSGDVSFTYLASDPFGGTSPATATISIAPAAPPLAEDYSTDEDVALVVDAGNGVLANDPVNAGDALTASLVTGPEHGSLVLEADGSFTYVPDADFNGSDAFIYNVTDSAGLTRESVAEITIDAVNDAPFFDLSTFVSAPLVGRFLVGDPVATVEAVDVDGDTLVFRIENKVPATNDADLFDLLTSIVSPTRAAAEVATSDLFPQTDADLRAAAGADNKLEIRLFVSDGEFEAFLDLGPGSLTAG